MNQWKPIVKTFWRPGTYVRVDTKNGSRFGVVERGRVQDFGRYGIVDYKNGKNGKVYSVHASTLTEITEAEYFKALLKGENCG